MTGSLAGIHPPQTNQELSSDEVGAEANQVQGWRGESSEDQERIQWQETTCQEQSQKSSQDSWIFRLVNIFFRNSAFYSKKKKYL